MADKRSLYKKEDILTIEFESGTEYECGIMLIFAFDGKKYIVLDRLEEEKDVFLFEYIPKEDGFDLKDIPDEDFIRVAEELDRLM